MKKHTTITWRATPEERLKMQALAQRLNRRTMSDLLRALVCDAYASFFTVVATNDYIPSAPVARPIPRDGACNED